MGDTSHPRDVRGASDPSSVRAPVAGVGMVHPRVFWLGIAAITFGVSAHLPMFFDAAPMHYRLYGMPIGAEMIAGMVAIAVGLALTVVGLVPRRPPRLARIPSVDVRVDDGKLGRAHASMLAVLTIAGVIDAMKGTTLGFVAPGAAG